MFVTDDGYKKAVAELVGGKDTVKMAVAFWGKGAAAFTCPVGSGPRQILCNLMSGGTNPYEIELLQSLPLVEVRQCSVLHAKVILGSECAVVGSANISSNGLGLEGDEQAFWTEAGMIVTDPGQLDAMQVWFEELWADAEREVSATDLAAAQVAWAKARARHPPSRASADGVFSLSDVQAGRHKRRKISVIVWRQKLDEAGRQGEEAVWKEFLAASTISGLDDRTQWEGYHGWDEEIAEDPDITYISIYYGASGATACHGAFKRVLPQGQYWDDRELVTLDFLKRVDEVDGRRFTRSEWKVFATAIQPILDKNLRPTNGSTSVEQWPDGFIKPLEKLIAHAE